jgi:hypothetical protein
MLLLVFIGAFFALVGVYMWLKLTGRKVVKK